MKDAIYARVCKFISLNTNKQAHTFYLLWNQGFERGVCRHEQLIPRCQGAHLTLAWAWASALAFGLGIRRAHHKFHAPFDNDYELIPIFRPTFQCRTPGAHHLNELEPARRPIRFHHFSGYRQWTELSPPDVVMVFVRARHHVCFVYSTSFDCLDCPQCRWVAVGRLLGDVLGRTPVPSHLIGKYPEFWSPRSVRVERLR